MQWQTAQHDGIYFVSAQIRLDGADQGWFSLAVLTNSEQSFETGMSSLVGDVTLKDPQSAMSPAILLSHLVAE